MASCFGDDALHEAAWRADEHQRRGDTCRSELWRQIAHSLREMRQR